MCRVPRRDSLWMQELPYCDEVFCRFHRNKLPLDNIPIQIASYFVPIISNVQSE